MVHIDVECPCGAVKLRLHGEPFAHFYCHCDDCQRVHAAAYVPIASYPKAAVEILSGETVTWALERLPRVSCARCGGRLFADGSVRSRSVMGALPPPGMFKPSFHIQCRFAVAPIADGLPHYQGLPAAFGGSDVQMDW